MNLHQGLYLYVLDKPRVDYTLAQGPLRRGAQLGAIGPIGLRLALSKPKVCFVQLKHPVIQSFNTFQNFYLLLKILYNFFNQFSNMVLVLCAHLKI